MRAVIAILAGIFGAVIGYVATAVAAFAILGDGGSGDSGGTAMGIFFSLAPIGALGGAIAGVVLALRATRRDPPGDGEGGPRTVGADAEPGAGY